VLHIVSRYYTSSNYHWPLARHAMLANIGKTVIRPMVLSQKLSKTDPQSAPHDSCF